MTPDNDAMLRAIADLPPVAADRNWEQRVRARCRRELARRAIRASPVESTGRGTQIAEAATAAALFGYVVAVLQTVVQLLIGLT